MEKFPPAPTIREGWQRIWGGFVRRQQPTTKEERFPIYVEAVKKRLTKHGFTRIFQPEEDPGLQDKLTTWIEYLGYEYWRYGQHALSNRQQQRLNDVRKSFPMSFASLGLMRNAYPAIRYVVKSPLRIIAEYTVRSWLALPEHAEWIPHRDMRFTETHMQPSLYLASLRPGRRKGPAALLALHTFNIGDPPSQLTPWPRTVDDNEVLHNEDVKQKHDSQGYWAPDHAPKSKDWYAENINGSGSQTGKAVIKQGFRCSDGVYGDLFQEIKTSAGNDPTFRRFNHNTSEYKTAREAVFDEVKGNNQFKTIYEDEDVRVAFCVSSVIKDDYQDILRRPLEGEIGNKSIKKN
ncbi:hypothetical protein K469DRAFT_698118 [Zopfia rhizophila CBS 207.26]|uniref:Uncharacterized protein n=1 Tax=Zopfia rhizophila CBS 207.26 TaxID=1314779 RepID=A0A6A6DEF8_9PEZI|nr:hypothetical protein K469DRAFT_698118 [Zopfia rhizophila CBS 207.26]